MLKLFTNIYLYVLIGAVCLLTSCEGSQKQYHIGMSQCAAGEWRDQMNHEVMREVLLHDEVSLDLCVSRDSSALQIKDIDSLINIPVDVLIVSPNNPKDLAPAINKAYDKGIPVILVDRDVESESYSAFIGGDNKEVGKMAGQYVAKLYDNCEGKKPTVLEIEGDPNITPVKNRHYGFMQEMNKRGIPFTSVVGYWHQHLAAAVTDSLIQNNLLPAIIYTHSDNMAIGVANKVNEMDKAGMVDIVSVDGSPQVGMKLVIDDMIKATIKYPTGGSEAIRTALDILQGKKYERTQYLRPLVIDHNNAYMLREQETKATNMTDDILMLGDRLTDYSKRSNWQLTMVIILSSMLIISIVCLVLVIHKSKVNRELQQEVMETIASPIASAAALQNAEKDKLEGISQMSASNSSFTMKLRELISANIANPNFCVDDMSDALDMGRTAFYRKTKNVTGYTPNDILRTMRLQHAAQLLRTTDQSISEICRNCGFNNPSYFTRAFRDQYSKTPKEYREQNN